MRDEYSEIEIENDAILHLLCRNLCCRIQFPPPVLQTTSAAPTPWVMVPQTPCVLPEVAPIKLLACSAFASHFVIRMSICDAPVIWIIRPYDLSLLCPPPHSMCILNFSQHHLNLSLPLIEKERSPSMLSHLHHWPSSSRCFLWPRQTTALSPVRRKNRLYCTDVIQKYYLKQKFTLHYYFLLFLTFLV
jgi:hypothetical protein